MGNVDMDNLGGGNTNDLGSYNSLATFTTTSSKTPASFVSTSFLTIRASLLSLSDKSTGGVVGNVDMDYATGSFCSSSYSIPPPAAGELWCSKGVRGGNPASLASFTRRQPTQGKFNRDIRALAARAAFFVGGRIVN